MFTYIIVCDASIRVTVTTDTPWDDLTDAQENDLVAEAMLEAYSLDTETCFVAIMDAWGAETEDGTELREVG